jgi:PhzF family phenazine biosynthesis protein
MRHATAMGRSFKQVDVFTTRPYYGNPVAVVLEADGLSAEDMQRFARWTNLSETTFVLPPREGGDYRVRIFTPNQELPFAGHPTLGTCHAWLEAGGAPAGREILQECGAGLVRVRGGETLAFAAPPLIRSGPVDEPDIRRAADALRIDRGAIVDAQWADNGPGWMAVLLSSAEEVLALEPGYVDFDLGVVGPGGAEDWELRAFFPVNGATVEDPVTGSLNASVAGWLLETGRATVPYTASQGTALGRAGRIRVSTDEDGTLWVGGGTVTCISGKVAL